MLGTPTGSLSPPLDTTRGRPVSDRNCSVEGCTNSGRMATKTLCAMHYGRKKRTGSVGPPGSLYDPDRGCSVEGCEEEHFGRGWCSKHYSRWKVTGDPLTERPVGVNVKPRPVPVPYNWRTMHTHLEREQGKARRRKCTYCGAQARDWSYNYEDPDVQYEPGNEMPFSLKLEHYIPLCSSCHHRLDNLNRARGRISDVAIMRTQQLMIERMRARIEELEAIIKRQDVS